MSNFCPITQTTSPLHFSVNTHLFMDIESLRELIYVADLGINFDDASEDEWVQTAFTDTHDFSDTLRLRNPITNQRFTEEELGRIYRFLSYSDENKTYITRSYIKKQ